ncbi:hypothetical protein GWI33_017142 [Rhynchophorus ferrugineus]|uniref:Uncharacterized protein n=1 Tax=Rhynchophorus ferrugineus TaxID=354439 RepID=A0A834M494_RHYFE|nr:hypothetical protein GWI33_017142 [Rhynchophorus ferrugineus]
MTNTTQVESITNEEAMVEEIINRKLAQIQHETNKRIQRIESLLQDREYSPAVFARPVMMDVSTRTDICRRIEMTTVEVEIENTFNTICTYNEVAATKKSNENKTLSNHKKHSQRHRNPPNLI